MKILNIIKEIKKTSKPFLVKISTSGNNIYMVKEIIFTKGDIFHYDDADYDENQDVLVLISWTKRSKALLEKELTARNIKYSTTPEDYEIDISSDYFEIINS